MRRLRQLFRSHPALSLFLAVVVLPLFVAALALRSYLLGTLPQQAGELQVEGLSAPVSISRDPHGVTRIEAETDSAVFFAMGYVHAQDRLWQLELSRRMAQGRLAEVFGRQALGLDIYVRTLGIHASAKQSVQALGANAQASLHAYAAGINAWIAEGHRLPVEFTLLGIEPQPWTPADSISWLKMFALNLSGNYQRDLNRYLLANKLGPRNSQVLLDDRSALGPATTSSVAPADFDALAQLANLGADLEQQWGIGSRAIGSNAWVVAARHAKDGVATLANDPHVGLDLPSVWYAVELSGDRLKSAGMSIIGLPIVLLGRNEQIAWGATNMMADTMDLYLEDVSPERADHYRRGDEWRAFDSHVETIAVKADFPAVLREPLAPVEIRVRRTDLGPVISDLIGGAERPLSLRWVGDSGSDVSYEAFLRLNYASDWRSFADAMQTHVSPALNLFYLDRQHNIGHLAVGRIPIRGRGDGSTPVPGWDAGAGWTGFIPPAEMPRSLNPEQGFIVSANNRVTDADYPYFISRDWAEPERAQRIEALLRDAIGSGTGMGIADHTAVQLDTFDRQPTELLPRLLEVTREDLDPQLERMLAILQAWDGTTAADSIGATVYHAWVQQLRLHLFADDLKPHWGNPALKQRMQQLTADTPVPGIRAALASTEFDWCDRGDTTEHESCDRILLDALTDAEYQLSKLLGSDIDDWQWGNAHQAIYRHRPFSSIKGLDFLFERRAPRGGSPNSINLSEFRFDAKDGYVQQVGAAFRQVIQFPQGGARHLYANSTGQSGNVMSAHYDDMVEAFSVGEFRQWPTEWAAAGRGLRLLPATSQQNPPQ